MPILDLQRRFAEVGRIRLGEQRVSGSGKRYPAALSTFRLTSPDRKRSDAVAAHYGGEVEAWDSPSGRQWDVTTEADVLPIMVTAESPVSQWYELWSGGGVVRRCDGVEDVVSGGACQCDPDDRACQPTTRLGVFLPELPGLGTWRVEAHGYNAAVELPLAVDLLRSISVDRLVPARLRIEARTVKRIGTDGKPVTQRFVVPVIDVDVSIADLLDLAAAPTVEIAGRRALDVVPDPDPASPAIRPELMPRPPAVAEQIAESDALAEPRSRVPLVRPGLPLRPAGLAPDRTPVVPSPRGGGSPMSGGGSTGTADASDPSPPPDAHASTLGPSHRRLMAAMGERFPDLSPTDRDAIRYALSASVTKDGRTSSSDLSASERDRVTRLVEEADVHAPRPGEWRIEYRDRLAIVRKDGEAYDVEVRTPTGAGDE